MDILDLDDDLLYMDTGGVVPTKPATQFETITIHGAGEIPKPIMQLILKAAHETRQAYLNHITLTDGVYDMQLVVVIDEISHTALVFHDDMRNKGLVIFDGKLPDVDVAFVLSIPTAIHALDTHPRSYFEGGWVMQGVRYDQMYNQTMDAMIHNARYSKWLEILSRPTRRRGF